MRPSQNKFTEEATVQQTLGTLNPQPVNPTPRCFDRRVTLLDVPWRHVLEETRLTLRCEELVLSCLKVQGLGFGVIGLMLKLKLLQYLTLREYTSLKT